MTGISRNSNKARWWRKALTASKFLKVYCRYYRNLGNSPARRKINFRIHCHLMHYRFFHGFANEYCFLTSNKVKMCTRIVKILFICNRLIHWYLWQHSYVHQWQTVVWLASRQWMVIPFQGRRFVFKIDRKRGLGSKKGDDKADNYVFYIYT